MFKDVMGE
jgi:hypothetical protein